MSGNRDLLDESDALMSPDHASNNEDRSPRSFRLQLSESPSSPATPLPSTDRGRPSTGRAGRARSASPTGRPTHTAVRRHLSDAARLLARLRSLAGEDNGTSPSSTDPLLAGDFAMRCSPWLSLPRRIALAKPHPWDTWMSFTEMECFLDNRE
jgi:hypothetical protein